MHRDLKSANILITSDCKAKVCDFGLARTVPATVMDINGFNSLDVRELTLAKHDSSHNKVKS
jgi:serine/threonine protein kinase